MNNREWATLILFSAFLLWALSQGQFRPSIRQMLKTTFEPKLALLWVGSAARIGDI